MFKLIAGVIVGMGALIHGMFGGPGGAPSENQHHEDERRQFMGSTTDPRMHNDSSTEDGEDRMHNGSSTFDGRQLKIEGIFGTVTAVNGAILSVSTERRATSSHATTTVIFSIDASSAKIFKGNGSSTMGTFMGTTTATIADIAVGDKVAVEGRINGTSITARVIIDGIRPVMRAVEKALEKRGLGNILERPREHSGSTTHDR